MPAIKIMVGNITVIISNDCPKAAIMPKVQKIEMTTIVIGTTMPYSDLNENHRNTMTKKNEMLKKYLNSFSKFFK